MRLSQQEANSYTPSPDDLIAPAIASRLQLAEPKLKPIYKR